MRIKGVFFIPTFQYSCSLLVFKMVGPITQILFIKGWYVLGKVLPSQHLWGLLWQRGSSSQESFLCENLMQRGCSLDTVASMWRACHFLRHCLLDPHLARISGPERAIPFCLPPHLAGLSAAVCRHIALPETCFTDPQNSPRLLLIVSSPIQLLPQSSSLEAACFLHSWLLSSAETLGIAFRLVVADPKPRNISKPKNEATTLGKIRTLQQSPKLLFMEVNRPELAQCLVDIVAFSATSLWELYWALTLCYTLLHAFMYRLIHSWKQLVLSPFSTCGNASTEKLGNSPKVEQWAVGSGSES